MNIPSFQSFLLTLTVTASVFAAEPIYQASTSVFSVSGPEHQARSINSKSSAAIRFKTDSPVSDVSVCCPSYANNIGSLRVSLYSWSESYEKSVAGTPLAQKKFTNFRDNASLCVSAPQGQPWAPGEFLLVVDKGREHVGVWVDNKTVDQTQSYFNGQPINGTLQITCYTSTPSSFPFIGTKAQYDFLNRPATCPPESKLDANSPILTNDVQPDTFAATDDLGRTLPNESEVGAVRAEKLVGIFYWTWHETGGPNVYNNTKLLQENPGIENRPDDPLWGNYYAGHHWGEPLLGFYKVDKWVMRKHAQMLANAQIDVAIFDCTNGTLTWMSTTWALLETWSQARKDGVKTPQIAFMLPFGNKEYNAIDLRQLYCDIYRDGKYQELWFYWQGKPLIYGMPDAVDDKIATSTGDEKKEWEAIRLFFSFRPGQPSYTRGPQRPDDWSWLEVYPQNGYVKRLDGTYDMVSVGVAQNHSEHKRDGYSGLCAMNDTNVFGRAWQVGKEPDPRPDAFKYGLNFEQQWSRAYELDPQFVFVTGWNEWVAGRYPNWLGQPNAFPDQYDQRYSRDIEPHAGDLRDIYYNQLVAKVRRFKGVRPVPKFGKPITIPFENTTPETVSAIWETVQPTFRDYKNDIGNRDAVGYANIHYTDNSGRNDIVLTKVARDDKYIYFMVETASPLTPKDGQNWMQLYISTSTDSNKPSWHSFQYVVNRNPVTDKATLERSTGGWNWERVADVNYRITENRLELRIERTALGLESGKPISLRFKWADNAFRPQTEDKTSEQADILDFYKYGDTAPDGRFSYQIQE